MELIYCVPICLDTRPDSQLFVVNTTVVSLANFSGTKVAPCKSGFRGTQSFLKKLFFFFFWGGGGGGGGEAVQFVQNNPAVISGVTRTLQQQSQKHSNNQWNTTTKWLQGFKVQVCIKVQQLQLFLVMSWDDSPLLPHHVIGLTYRCNPIHSCL